MVYYVFLDTNIYEESNFSFENGKFTKLNELVKAGNVILLYNEVIYREVRQHIENNIKEAVGEYNAAVKNKGFAPFRNSKDWGGHLLLLDEQKLVEQQWRAWDDYLKDCGAIKIPTKGVDVDAILDNYFKRILPFENKKPNEFKDAISIESIREQFEIIKENEFAEELFVVAADKGVRKSFRNDRGIVALDNLNKFINYVILHTEYLAVAINSKIEDGEFDDFIQKNVIDEVYLANCDIENCYDDFDIDYVEYVSHKVGYIDISDEQAEVTLEISAKICVDYMERDEDNSFYDREEGRYLWEEFSEYQEWHEVSFEATMILNIDELDEKAIKEKVNTCNELLEELDETIIKINVEPENIFIPRETIISMDDWTLIERKEIRSTVNDWEEEEEYIGDKPYTTCPACGKPISFENDGGNGFCINCAPDH